MSFLATNVDPAQGISAPTVNSVPQLEICLGISTSQLNTLMSDLKQHRPFIYWCDLLLSLAIGYGGWWMVDSGAFFSWSLLWLIPSVLGLYRATMFTHEIAHMPASLLRSFYFVWNFLCGVLLLIPSFSYEMHSEHHSRRTYGSSADGEYERFVMLPRRVAIGFIVVSFIAGPALVVRFFLLAPLGWLVPSFRRWLFAKASSLVIALDYDRLICSGSLPYRWLWQEIACFVWCGLVMLAVSMQAVPLVSLAQGYIIVTGLCMCNALRVLVAHRYLGDGEPMSFVDQVLDSNTFPSLSAELMAPIGLRYHATHHLLPAMPYHSLGEAHRRLMRAIPIDSPFRLTVRTSVLVALSEVLGPRLNSASLAARRKAALRSVDVFSKNRRSTNA
jgi:fatty acid desaturase